MSVRKVRITVILALVLLWPSGYAQLNEELSNELISMEVDDQAIRNLIIQQGGFENAPGDLMEEMSRIDERHTARLKKIFQDHSWPNKELVGVSGVGAAFILLQHSPDLKFQEEMLPYIKKSFDRGEGIQGSEVALLTDRVRVRNGNSQLYGSQFKFEDGGLVYISIEDEENVDERRAKLGMPSMECYKKMAEELYKIEDHPDSYFEECFRSIGVKETSN